MTEDINAAGNRYDWSRTKGKEKTSKLPDGVRMSYEPERIVQEFDSMQAVLDFSRYTTTPNRDAWADLQLGKNPGASNKPSAEWFGIDGGVEAVKAAIREGWPEGVEQMRAALADIGATFSPVSIRRRRVWTDQGDALDIHRVYSGAIDTAWQRCKRSQRPACQNVTIAANVTALYGVDARSLFWRGAAVLKLADLLTDSGYNVRIDAIRSCVESFTDGRGLLQRVTVKDYRAPLELNGLASSLCLSGFFRYVLFSCMCSGPKIKKHKGMSIVYESSTGEICGVEKCQSADSARAWINDAIASIQDGERLAA